MRERAREWYGEGEREREREVHLPPRPSHIRTDGQDGHQPRQDGRKGGRKERKKKALNKRSMYQLFMIYMTKIEAKKYSHKYKVIY